MNKSPPFTIFLLVVFEFFSLQQKKSYVIRELLMFDSINLHFREKNIQYRSK